MLKQDNQNIHFTSFSNYLFIQFFVKFEFVTNIIPFVGSLVKFQSSNSNASYVSTLRIFNGQAHNLIM